MGWCVVCIVLVNVPRYVYVWCIECMYNIWYGTGTCPRGTEKGVKENHVAFSVIWGTRLNHLRTKSYYYR